ncbi:MAG: membrane protease subunit HflC [Gammaproteobacteria bacterium]|jgi:membrane protease subunit HflC
MGQLKLLGVLAVIAAAIASFSLFVVDEREKAIKFQLGKVIESKYEPGLQFKIPLLQNVLKFDSRIQTLDAAPELYLTNEKKNVKVDSFVKWQIADVERFFTSTGGSIVRAGGLLHAINQKDLKDAFGKRTIAELVAGERTKMMLDLTVSLDSRARDLGIEVIDVRLKRIDLPDDVSSSVYRRMEAERKEVAQQFRSRGEEEAKKIRAIAEREREVILANATRDGQRLRGEGDGVASETYATAYNADPEFYALYRSLQAYTTTFSDKSDVLLLTPDSEFFRFFKDKTGQGQRQ